MLFNMKQSELIEVRSSGNTSLLQYAAGYNVPNIVSMLLNAGIDVLNKDGSDVTALDYAKINNSTECAHLIEEQ